MIPETINRPATLQNIRGNKARSQSGSGIGNFQSSLKIVLTDSGRPLANIEECLRCPNARMQIRLPGKQPEQHVEASCRPITREIGDQINVYPLSIRLVDLIGMVADAPSEPPPCLLQKIDPCLTASHGGIRFDKVSGQNTEITVFGEQLGLALPRRSIRAHRGRHRTCRSHHRTVCTATHEPLHFLVIKLENTPRYQSHLQDTMEQRRYHIDPVHGEFILLEWDASLSGWMPAVEILMGWQRGMNRIFRPANNASHLLTMPDYTLWSRLPPAEVSRVRSPLARPWISDRFIEHADNIEDAFHRLGLDDPHLSQALSASLSAAPPPTPRGPPPPAFPAHLVSPVLAAAEAERKICPITMEPIRKRTAAITSCGHIFQKEAIQEWLNSHDTCPECRQRCSL